MNVIQKHPRIRHEPHVIVVEEDVPINSLAIDSRDRRAEHRFESIPGGESTYRHVETVIDRDGSWIDTEKGSLSAAIHKLLREIHAVNTIVDEDGNVLGSVEVHVEDDE